jgi:starch synthase
MDLNNLRVALLPFGFADYTIQLANALYKKEIDILILIPDHNIKEHIDFLDVGIKRYIYASKRLYDPMSIQTIYKLLKQIIQFDPDIIHTQGGYFWFTFLLPILDILGYKILTTFHDIDPHVGEDNIRFRFISCSHRAFSDQFIVHGKALKKLMIKKYRLPEDNLHVIPIGEHNVAPFKKYEDPNVKDEGNLVLFFGRIWEYKGLEYLIKAEPIITKEVPGSKITIAGKGEDFDKYRKMMVNKDNFIIYNRYISYKEGAYLFQRSSVVVLPYIDASQSGVISSAYGFKKPVVVTNVGSIPEIVDNEITGLIVPPRDVQALADAIIRLLKDRELRSWMGENSYRKLKGDLSWEKIAELTIDVYRDLKENNLKQKFM